MVRLRNDPKYKTPEYARERQAIIDAVDEATWERMRKRDAETQRIMRPLAREFFQSWEEEEYNDLENE